jgi:hypothetical protein
VVVRLTNTGVLPKKLCREKELIMRKALIILASMVCLGIAQPASAELFAFNLDGQIGYSVLQNIQEPLTTNTQTLSDMAVGARAKLKVLFLCLMADYQHFVIKNADYFHAGLGVDFGLPLGVIKPYVRGSVGLMALAAKAGAFDPKAGADLGATVGGQARAGIGLDIPLGNWFAVGASFDFGYHYITSNWGYDLSVMGYAGLRI